MFGGSDQGCLWFASDQWFLWASPIFSNDLIYHDDIAAWLLRMRWNTSYPSTNSHRNIVILPLVYRSCVNFEVGLVKQKIINLYILLLIWPSNISKLKPKLFVLSQNNVTKWKMSTSVLLLWWVNYILKRLLSEQSMFHFVIRKDVVFAVKLLERSSCSFSNIH